MVREDALPFRFDGGPRGVLLVHGFTGTPFEMRWLGERLAAHGFTVHGPVLEGHASTGEALDATRWPDWYATVTRELDALRARVGERVAVVGLSLGGLLTLRLARERGAELRAIGVLSAPLWLPGYVGPAVQAIRRLATWLPRASLVPKPGGGSDVRDAEMRRKNPSLPVFPVNALGSLLELTRIVRADVERIREPGAVFLAHGARDHTAPPAATEELARRLPARDLRLLRLRRSFHVITIDVEREALAEALGEFLDERV